MDFDKDFKKELLEDVIERLKEKVKEASEEAELTREEKIKIAYQEIVDPYGFLGSSVRDSATIELLKEKVKKQVDSLYNQSINCGGYALKIDTCIFASSMPEENEKQTLERNVTRILEYFPFVRLLGDTKLQEDEYLVEYRAGIGQGHHFVRIEQNGKISDKNNSQPPRNIRNIIGNEDEVWGRLKDCPRAIFAVKSEHEMRAEPSYFLHNGHNFEETVLEHLNNGINEFEYHNHKYVVAEDVKGDKIISSEGEPVAAIIADDSGTIVVQREEKKDYISNTKSKTYDKYMEQLISEKENEYDERQMSIDTDEDFELEL